MTETQFNELLERYTQGLCTPEETQQLERWMDTIREGGSPFKSQSEKTATKQVLHQAIYAKAGLEKNNTRTLVPAILKVAASVAVLITVAYGLWTYTDFGNQKGAEITYAAAADITKQILPDSTIVWIKPGASLAWQDKGDGMRHVSIDGEVLFEVAKDAAHPFVVTYGALTAKVLGTSFNIKPTAAGIEVLVLTGKVAVSSGPSQSGMIILPNEKVLFNQVNNTLAKVEPLKEEPAQSIKGTEYSMSFDHTKMSDIIQAIEAKFSVDVTVTDAAINNCLLSADFTDQSLTRTLKLMSEAMNYTYEIKNGSVTITGSGCK